MGSCKRSAPTASFCWKKAGARPNAVEKGRNTAGEGVEEERKEKEGDGGQGGAIEEEDMQQKRKDRKTENEGRAQGRSTGREGSKGMR